MLDALPSAPPDLAPPPERDARARAAPSISLEHVVFEARGRRLLDGLSLSLPACGIAALLGPNGAGKSLALRLAAGLLAPTAGRVRWAGGERPSPGLVGLVFQRPVLLRRTVAGNLVHALRLAGVARRHRAERLDALLAMARLERLAASPARALSGGEQQRLALARALAFRPRHLLLDEPAASLDPEATALIEALIRRVAEAGAAITLVTHDIGQARRLADRALFLHRGRLVEDAPAATFFREPRSPEARAYLDGRLLT